MSFPKTLLLSAHYEVINFIPARKVFKLLVKEKVEVIDTFDEIVSWGSGSMKYPAILRLKHHVKRSFFNANFSRKALVKRDKSICQYCRTKLTPSQITIDHVIPRVKGGGTTFLNCVVSCHACNNKKADKTPEEAGMTLLRRPMIPSFTAAHYAADPQDRWFPAWSDYLGI